MTEKNCTGVITDNNIPRKGEYLKCDYNSCIFLKKIIPLNMSRKEKLLLRFLSQPKDFTFDEAVRLLKDFEFYEVSTGKTSGSRVRFKNDSYPLNIVKFHKPHPSNILKPYVLDIIKTNLEECKLINTKEDENE